MPFGTIERVNTIEAAYAAISGRPSDIREHLPELRRAAGGRWRILELGVNEGISTVALLAGMMDHARMLSVDVQPPCEPLASIRMWCAGELYPRWRFVCADDRDLFPRLAQIDGQWDLIFLDTSHEYGHTCVELDWIGRLAAPGGLVLLHDTESCPGVKQAMVEFARRMGWRCENREYCNGLGVLRPPG